MLKCRILLLAICVSLLAGCGEKNNSNDSNSSVRSQDETLVDASSGEIENVSESERSEIESCVRFAELLGFGEFDSVSDLGRKEAIAYVTFKEYEINSEDGLFKKHGVSAADGGSVRLSDEIMSEMLLKHFGNGDISSYKNDVEAESCGFDIPIKGASLVNLAESYEKFHSGLDSVKLEFDSISVSDDVYSLVVDRLDDDGNVVNKLEYGLSKNDDGSYCLKYRRIVR